MMNVLKTGVNVLWDVNTVPLIVKTMTHVPKIAATQALDVLINMLSVTTMTLVPLILAALSKDANTLM
jgi:hypothetical protein